MKQVLIGLSSIWTTDDRQVTSMLLVEIRELDHEISRLLIASLTLEIEVLGGRKVSYIFFHQNVLFSAR